jgi:hypothetical protein
MAQVRKGLDRIREFFAELSEESVAQASVASAASA